MTKQNHSPKRTTLKRKHILLKNNTFPPPKGRGIQ